jgi:DDE family transposase
MIDQAPIRDRFSALSPHLNERERRLLAATEATAAGYGGIAAVSQATGIAASTIGRGLKELAGEAAIALGRVRRSGGGRKPLTVTNPALLTDLLALVEPGERGDPMSPLRWTCKGLRQLAAELTARGHRVSRTVVGELLKRQKFSLQANSKTQEGGDHPDRDAQFIHINQSVKAALAAQQPVISVDTKKKELVGNFKNAGREWRPQGDPEEVGVYDFLSKALGRAVPYGIYDIAANAGWVSVGMNHDTSAFAVQTVRRWWQDIGRVRYPDARSLTITCDGGGSNGYRVKLWKRELQGLADELGIDITVHHLPPGTSKWNKIGVSRTHPRRKEVWSYTRDGGRPPEAGSQVQVSNHCKLLSSKAMVVSVAAKGGIQSRQVWSGEASESKPSMTCRNSIGDVKTGGAIFSRDQRGGGPEACPSGIRHVGGAKPDQALVWNVRTCRSDAKGDVQAAKTARTRVPMRGTGAEPSVVGLKVL